ncbi:MAG: 3'-5' exonuclease [Pseudomonadales bacterium]|nr:3'-5' exonuclease [Pseudomonadales bacterium]
MAILFIDTETNKKYDFKAHYTAEHQPYVLQIAALMFDDNRKKINEASLLVYPYGLWDSIDTEAEEIHGISYDMCKKYGIPPNIALDTITYMFGNCDTLVGHNLSHEINMLLRTEHVAGPKHVAMKDVLSQMEERMNKAGFCTMKEFTKRNTLPGNKWNKWASLQEMHKFYFGKGFDGAHDALADVWATARCYFEMKDREENIDYDQPN